MNPRNSEEKEKMREAVNKWICESGAYDAVADFDAVVCDPAIKASRGGV